MVCIDNATCKIPKYNILFFGTQKTATVKQTDICLYTENKSRHAKLKTQDSKNNKFNTALKEAGVGINKDTANETVMQQKLKIRHINFQDRKQYG